MSDIKAKVEIDEEVLRQADKIMSETKVQLIVKQPFFGVLMSMTDFICDPYIKTAATDGVKIYYNPNFILSLTKAEVYGLLLHEIFHCIYMHMKPERRQGKIHKRWNIATDHAINIEIDGMAKFIQVAKQTPLALPKVALLDYKYKDMTAEQIYNALPENIEKYFTLDDHLEASDDEGVWSEVEDKIIAAYESTKDSHSKKGSGALPGKIENWIKLLRKPKVPWQRVFLRYIGEAIARDDFSYVRPNKRFLAQKIYLPGLRNNVLGKLVVVFDTSGSISEDQGVKFCSELKKISHLVEEIVIMTCDAEVHEVIKINKTQDFMNKLKFKGRFGTSFVPAFDKVEEMKINPELLIYLTDAYGDFPEDPPPYPVLWCLTDNAGTVPWGASVHIPED